MIAPPVRVNDFNYAEGYLWPAGDRDCRNAVFREVDKLEAVYPYCKGFSVAVQAGGNCGVFATAMAQRFATVYTFEPDPTNFYACVANTPDNVIRLQVALGGRNEPPVDLTRQAGNCGAHQVQAGGAIPVLALDTLNLAACDLLFLDIEGYELRAMQGAAATIRRYKPVIGIENKGLSRQYHVSPEGVHDWVLEQGYRMVEKLGNDRLYAPC